MKKWIKMPIIKFVLLNICRVSSTKNGLNFEMVASAAASRTTEWRPLRPWWRRKENLITFFLKPQVNTTLCCKGIPFGRHFCGNWVIMKCDFSPTFSPKHPLETTDAHNPLLRVGLMKNKWDKYRSTPDWYGRPNPDGRINRKLEGRIIDKTAE